LFVFILQLFMPHVKFNVAFKKDQF